MRKGSTVSCGCKRKIHSITHGKHGSPEYQSWRAMRERCLNPNSIGYKNYGGRGIKVCERWINNFQNFLDDMGKRPNGLTLDRIDNNGDYTPENCRWTDRKTQVRNRRPQIVISYNGETLSIRQWSERTGQKHDTIYNRMKKGWPTKEVIYGKG